jgi:putative flippase GtrA
MMGSRGGRPLRYVIAGLLNTAFSIGIYPALLWAFPYFQTHYMQGLAIVQPIGIIFSFATQKLGVFRTAGNVVAEFVKYVSFYMIYFIMNWAALPILVEVLLIPPIIAQTAFQTIAIVGGYFWHSRVTFLGKPAQPIAHCPNSEADPDA